MQCCGLDGWSCLNIIGRHAIFDKSWKFVVSMLSYLIFVSESSVFQVSLWSVFMIIAKSRGIIKVCCSISNLSQKSSLYTLSGIVCFSDWACPGIWYWHIRKYLIQAVNLSFGSFFMQVLLVRYICCVVKIAPQSIRWRNFYNVSLETTFHENITSTFFQ